ncbi:MAG TPA: hypothetical protein VG273_24740 [Bryobacteraceae bacterium]|jgi:hypothetical protein|nr:hypothetical protein [Bryobacteraceae bacterium]
MSRLAARIVVFVTFCSGIVLADQNPAPAAAIAHGPTRAADPAVRYHRLICLVHLKGSGKKDDPRLPEYAPATIDPSRSGIIAWSMQLTDNGNMAIVQFVAVDRQAFAEILADKRADIKVFEIGKDKPAAIEAEMKKHKSTFALSGLQVVAQ